MMIVIEEHHIRDLTLMKLPSFNKIRPRDKNILFMEICTRKYKFDKLAFF